MLYLARHTGLTLEKFRTLTAGDEVFFARVQAGGVHQQSGELVHRHRVVVLGKGLKASYPIDAPGGERRPSGAPATGQSASMALMASVIESKVPWGRA